MAGLRAGTRSTRDSDISFTGRSDAGGGPLRAKLRFVSHQDAGDGPKRNPDESCTRWAATYTLSVTADGAYRIRKSTATAARC
jgi:hypothetical protein